MLKEIILTITFAQFERKEKRRDKYVKRNYIDDHICLV